uniref:Predicted protein n=1 Tax=Hordeum vulgare subsp. vulgare TaxID=112509 RepID=F2EA30_HORVV|nr:predicted protein [Hordeum vulgare subsp. vulgare]
MRTSEFGTGLVDAFLFREHILCVWTSEVLIMCYIVAQAPAPYHFFFLPNRTPEPCRIQDVICHVQLFFPNGTP